ncbi:MAG: hypothetical protein QNJ78_04215 [Gammaproteobacteria bacterium]|nr:hypothetical protein [Gammaproteobacteria bacterium]
MKFTWVAGVLMVSFGVAQAGSDREQRPTATTQAQATQSSAVQPGIGDRANRFGQRNDQSLGDDHADWTDLRNEEIYGTF